MELAEAAEVDPEALEGVDDFGFDAQGNFYPLKGMPEERFDAFLDTVSRQGAEYWVDKMARNAAELHDTGVLREDAWKLEWLDEYGYLVPEALEPGLWPAGTARCTDAEYAPVDGPLWLLAGCIEAELEEGWTQAIT